QSRLGQSHSRRAIPCRFVLPIERVAHDPAATAPTTVRHSALNLLLCGALLPATRQANYRRGARHDGDSQPLRLARKYPRVAERNRAGGGAFARISPAVGSGSTSVVRRSGARRQDRGHILPASEWRIVFAAASREATHSRGPD